MTKQQQFAAYLDGQWGGFMLLARTAGESTWDMQDAYWNPREIRHRLEGWCQVEVGPALEGAPDLTGVASERHAEVTRERGEYLAMKAALSEARPGATPAEK